MQYDEALWEEMSDMGADPHLVAFILAWHGMIGTTQASCVAERDSRADQKTIKHGKATLNERVKPRPQKVLSRNLFKIEPCLPPNPQHRPRNLGRWDAICDLRNYFTELDGRPHMSVLRRLFYPKQKDTTFNAEWHKRKDWFKNEKGKNLEKLQGLYHRHQLQIREALETKTPFILSTKSSS